MTSLARGNGNKQIARALDISEKTVRNHVSNIHKKLHVHDDRGESSTPSGTASSTAW